MDILRVWWDEPFVHFVWSAYSMHPIRRNVVIFVNALAYVRYRSNGKFILYQSHASATHCRWLDSIPRLLVVQPLLERCRHCSPESSQERFAQVLNATVPGKRTTQLASSKMALLDVSWQN